jgi:hypothetical protein
MAPKIPSRVWCHLKSILSKDGKVVGVVERVVVATPDAQLTLFPDNILEEGDDATKKASR